MKDESASTSPSAVQGRLLPALKVGAVSGIAGFVSGGVVAALRSHPNVGLFSLGAGYQWFLLGSVYTGYREQLLISTKALYPNYAVETPRDRIVISGIAGSLTGATVGLITRGRRNVVPGAIMWGLTGLLGQWGYTVADEAHTAELELFDQKPTAEQNQKRSLMDVIFRSSWSPVKRLTEDEYIRMLEKKLLVVDADIALVDEEIKALKATPQPKNGSE